MKKYMLALVFSVLAVLFNTNAVSAVSDRPIFPIADLGGCASKTDCRAYCNEDEHIPLCIQYSIDHNLISAEEKANAEKLLKLMDPSGAPGECRDRVECLKLCDSVASTLECVAYAKRNGLFRDSGDKESAEKMAELLRQGVSFPGGCQTQGQCETYCENEVNFDECAAFAEKAGLIKPDELEDFKKVQPFMAKGETPGGCKSKESCESYCDDTSNIEECFAFAEKAGLIPKEDLENARKTIGFMKRGEMPGGCRTKDECESYCRSEEHIDECIKFGLKAGIMTEDEAKMARAFLERGGPGGCKSKDECESFCDNGDNQKACLEFAKNAGLVSEDDAKFFEDNMARNKGGGGSGGFAGMPDEMRKCLEGKLGTDTVGKLTHNELTPNKEMMSAIRGCVEDFQKEMEKSAPMRSESDSKEMREGGESGGFGDFGGPGGCKTSDECMIYCKNNPDACKNFAPPAPSGENDRADHGGEECVKQGGAWDGGACQFPRPQNQTNENQYQQSYLDEYKKQCEANGGAWDGNQCGSPSQ